MAVPAIIHRAERGHERQSVDLSGTLRDHNAVALDIVLEDLSQTGFRTEPGPPLAVEDRISLGLPGMGMRSATVVRRSGGGYGCEFDMPLSFAELESVLAAPAFQPIPFPSAHLPVASAEAEQAFPLPPLEPYSRRVRLIGGLALAAAGWALVGLVVTAIV